jgi:hypothetical protein
VSPSLKTKSGRSPRRFPTPHEIADAPELALLHALDEILDLVPRVLIAAHPELGDPEAPYWVRQASRITRKANDIATTAHRLQQRIRAYRTAITLERDQQLETDPEIPF